MCLYYIHEPWISIRVFLSEWIFGMDITMDNAWILQTGGGGRKRQNERPAIRVNFR